MNRPAYVEPDWRGRWSTCPNHRYPALVESQRVARRVAGYGQAVTR